MTVRRAAVLLGTPIDDITMDESLDVIATMVSEGRRTGRVHQIATVNVDFVVNAAADEGLHAIMRATDLSIPDGMGIVWGARLVRTPIRERTAGVDLVPALARRAAQDGWRLCLLGGAPGIADRAADRPARAGAGRRRGGRSGADGRRRRVDGSGGGGRGAGDRGRRDRRRPREPEAGALDRQVRAGDRRAGVHRHRRDAGLPHRHDAAGPDVDATIGPRVDPPGAERAAAPDRPLRPRPVGVRSGTAAPDVDRGGATATVGPCSSTAIRTPAGRARSSWPGCAASTTRRPPRSSPSGAPPTSPAAWPRSSAPRRRCWPTRPASMWHRSWPPTKRAPARDADL